VLVRDFPILFSRNEQTMSEAKISQKPKANQSKYYEEFEVIKDTPKNVANVIMRKPPKKLAVYGTKNQEVRLIFGFGETSI